MNDITDTKREMAENLFYSLRGRYLMERAIVLLLKELNEVKGVHKEVGDIRTQLLNTFPDSMFEQQEIPNAIV